MRMTADDNLVASFGKVDVECFVTVIGVKTNATHNNLSIQDDEINTAEDF